MCSICWFSTAYISWRFTQLSTHIVQDSARTRWAHMGRLDVNHAQTVPSRFNDVWRRIKGDIVSPHLVWFTLLPDKMLANLWRDFATGEGEDSIGKQHLAGVQPPVHQCVKKMVDKFLLIDGVTPTKIIDHGKAALVWQMWWVPALQGPT